MKIAFTTKGIKWDSAIDPRFGRAEYFLIYDDEKDELLHYDNRNSENELHGAGPNAAQKLFEFEPDILITGNGPGGNATLVLEKTGTKVYIGADKMTVKEALIAFKKGLLNG